MVGQKTNLAYQVGLTGILKDIVSKHSIHWAYNIKSDYFVSSHTAIDNWAIRHGVGGGYSLIQSDSSGNTVPRFDAWVGDGLGDNKDEFAVGTVIAPQNTWNFVNDLSNTATGALVAGAQGGGDYTPAANSPVPLIPAGETIFAVDLLGRAVPTDGTAVAGALQRVV